jgi:beta-galactosidase
MKWFLYVAALTLGALVAAGTTDGAMAREVHNISAGWTFFTADVPSTDNASVVNLPHIQTTTGTVNYLKEIDIPLTWADKRVFLRIGGAARVADIFVGGVHTATHHGGNSSFTVEITDRLRWGSPAQIRIVVDSAPSLDVLPTAGSEKIYGGIFREVELIVCDSLAISPAASLSAEPAPGAAASATAASYSEGGDGIWISTDRLSRQKAEGTVRLALLTPSTPTVGAHARMRFTDHDGNLVAQNTLPVTSPQLSIPFTLSNPHLWQGVSDPWLYNVEVRLTTAEGVTTDSLTIRTGFRSVAVDTDNNLTINGIPTKIHGVVLHRDRIMVGTALTPFQIEEDVDFIREMGANAVRVVGGQHSDYFYTLCDEAGLLVWNDAPFTGAAYPTDIDFVDTGAFRENGRRQLGEMISQLYNHPSVVMWGVFSNVAARTASLVPYVRSLNDLAHKLDPHRLTAASSVQDGEVNFITDLVSFDLSLGWQSGLPDAVVIWLRQLRSGWPDLRAGVSYSAGGSIFHQSERLERPSPTSSYHPEGWQTFFHEEYMRYAVDAPGLWGVFVGNMFDSGAAKATPDASAHSLVGSSAGSSAGGGIDDRGLVTFDRKDRKDAFWMYKANWNHSDPFVRIASSRLGNRTERRQTIRVYSNQPEVELFIGGRTQGRRTGEEGIFVWENVAMRPGVNRLEARAAGAASDRASITISSTAQ